MVRDIELLSNFELLKEKDIVLYGASSKGRKQLEFFREAGLSIVAYGDSDNRKAGKIIDGLSILSPKQIIEMDGDIAIIVASSWFSDIIKCLEELGFNGDIYTNFAVDIAFRMNYKTADFSEDFIRKYEYRLKWEEKTREMQNKNGYFSMERLNEVGYWMACGGFQKQNVIILHPCKVASTSIDQSLSMSGLNALHRHQLLPYPNFRENEKEIYDEFSGFIKKKNIKIITLVREPIIHDLSLFFNYLREPYRKWYQGFKSDFYTLYNEHITKNWGEKAEWKDEFDSYEEFNIQCMLGGKNYGYFEWFEYEIKQLFGVDILSYPFNQEKGYTIIKKDNIEILVMQMEKLNSLVKVIAEFVEIPDFELHNTNMADDKEYQYIYNVIKKNMRYPKWYIDLYYKNNKYMNYFYSKQDQEEFLTKFEIE